MTDSYPPPTTHTGHESAHAPLSKLVDFRYGLHTMELVQEDDGQISCFCGFEDDDGNTVACDQCNRWQHTICYYPQYDGQSLPEELQHFCVDCQPRDVNKQAAYVRQTARREQSSTTINGAKRPAAKSHKKKVKDAAGTGYTNGWPLDKVRHDRNSASPRDQPPPAKRPKTNHRASDSTTNPSVKGHSRKRTATNANHSRSISQSPETPIDYYSPEFMRSYFDDQWAVTKANLYSDIGVMNRLAEWLHEPNDVFYQQLGVEKSQVLMRWDGRLDDIPKAQIDILEQHDEVARDDHENYPTWKIVTVQDPVAPGGFIGELKGHVGFKDEYKSDPSNRWPLLRHPEPFVFFHQRLPIYVDARHEGTELRYVRRSCQPNAELKVLITNKTDYRFCIMATELIEPGMEVAVNWDTSDVPGRLERYESILPSRVEMTNLSAWVSVVLSNCGPCACELPPGDCYMSRFDRRGMLSLEYEDDVPEVKPPKSRKKKQGQHISPLNTHAVNSRSGSEARKNDPDDEPTDSRSASGSGGRGSISRDITPNTHYSANGSIMPELSERERKKLAKEEEMFRRQEEEQSGKHTKKKRASAGSAVNTPSATSSKHLSFPAPKYADAGTSKQPGFPSARSSSGKRSRASTIQKASAKPAEGMSKRPKPTYVDAEVQCDLEEEEAATRRAVMPSPRRKFMSTTQRLLQRCAMNNVAIRNASPTIYPVAAKSAGSPMAMEVDHPTSEAHLSSPASASRVVCERPSPQAETKTESHEDVRMDDAPQENSETKASSISQHAESPAADESPPSAKYRLVTDTLPDPPEPPWQPTASSPSITAIMSSQPLKHAEMHLQMPPPPANPFAGSGTLLSATSPSSLTGSISQSPASLLGSAPLFSPAVTAAVTPSPARKKLSLSDYTRRTKAKDKDQDPKTDRDSSPASVASGPIVPSLQPSVSCAVEDDVKMEDAGDARP